MMEGYEGMSRSEKQQTAYWKSHQKGIDAERATIGEAGSADMPANGYRGESNTPGWTIWDYGNGIRIDFTRGYDPQEGRNTSVETGTFIRP